MSLTFQIDIHTTIKGMAFSLEVKEADTIATVKEMIYKSEGVFTDCQKLFYDKKLLGNDKTLGDYNIKSGSKIFLQCTLKSQC